jgi:hypothetical protein
MFRQKKTQRSKDAIFSDTARRVKERGNESVKCTARHLQLPKGKSGPQMASDREQEEYHLFLRRPYFYRSADPIIGSDSQRDGAGVGPVLCSSIDSDSIRRFMWLRTPRY